jgi:hypothetical protein
MGEQSEVNEVGCDSQITQYQCNIAFSEKKADWFVIKEQKGCDVLEWCPGNGTKYILFLQTVYSKQLRTILGCGNSAEAVLVTWWRPGRRSLSYPFRVASHYAISYVKEKLGGSEEDAWRISQLLATALDGTCAEMGPYGPEED